MSDTFARLVVALTPEEFEPWEDYCATGNYDDAYDEGRARTKDFFRQMALRLLAGEQPCVCDHPDHKAVVELYPSGLLLQTFRGESAFEDAEHGAS